MKSAADLFRLKKYESELKSLEGFGEKSIENLFQSIESSREPSLAMFIYSLGIPEVGETTADQVVWLLLLGSWIQHALIFPFMGTAPMESFI